MFLHIKLMEQECQGLLDNGAIGGYTRLYYREIMARFGHHLSLNWNICEEGGDWAKDHRTPPMNATQRLAAAEWFYQNDPYQHLFLRLTILMLQKPTITHNWFKKAIIALLIRVNCTLCS